MLRDSAALMAAALVHAAASAVIDLIHGLAR